MANISAFPRNGAANTVDALTQLEAKLGVTGSVTFQAWTVTVAAQDVDRQDTILNHLLADPNILTAGYQ